MEKSKTRKSSEKIIYATFKILKDNGGELRRKEVMEKIRESVEFDEYEKGVYEKTGYIRWESILQFYTIDCVKAGFLRKNKSLWTLTNEGEEALNLGPEELLSTISKKYKKWHAERKESTSNGENGDEIDIESDTSQAQKAELDRFEDEASNGIREYVFDKNPYEFQDLVAGLLRAMNYHISDIAQKGPDGGIDIIAYSDPLGTKQPRIIVQVKHRPNDAVSSDDIQKLAGTLKRTTDVGIFVTSGTFSKPAIKEARNSREHIELIDFDRFISLWVENYNNMTDEQKNILPLHPIYFLGSSE